VINDMVLSMSCEVHCKLNLTGPDRCQYMKCPSHFILTICCYSRHGSYISTCHVFFHLEFWNAFNMFNKCSVVLHSRTNVLQQKWLPCEWVHVARIYVVERPKAILILTCNIWVGAPLKHKDVLMDVYGFSVIQFL